MTLGRNSLKKANSPLKSPKLSNSSLRKRTLLKHLSQEVQFGAASKANLKVVVRVRPENERELQNNTKPVIDIVDDHMLVFDPNDDEEDFFFQGKKQKLRDLNKKQHREQKFIFENIFGPNSSNEEIFKKTTKDLVATLLNGYNCSVFAYGATGAGKTYTMLGKENCPGIAFLTVMELYDKLKEVEDSKKNEVAVSYLEIYNEAVRDLLDPGKPLNLHESGKQVQVSGLTLHKPKSADELMELLTFGNQNRTQHPTDSNAESSRSHAVFQVFLKQQDHSPGFVSGVSIAKLSMIDLAGSERGTATGFKGARFREGANINKSLLALGNCINALADGKGHIPYRDSKLTRLLKDSIGGNCRSVMIAAISRASSSYEDSFNTLRYAHRAKTIKSTLKKNLLNVDQHVSRYLKIVEELKAEVTSLNDKIKSLENEAATRPISFSSNLIDDERSMYENTIMELQKQLESENSKMENKEEKQILKEFNIQHSQLKNSRRELLQMEATEREVNYKAYSKQIHLTKMRLFANTSVKLDKAIAKTERSLESLDIQSKHVKKKKISLSSNLETCSCVILSLCENLKTLSPLNEISEKAKSIIEKCELEMSVRDSNQAMNYLKTILKDSIGSHIDKDKLELLLLYGFKYFYVKLKSLNESDQEADHIFQNVLSLLDSNRIEWADQKRTDDSFSEEILSRYVPSFPSSINPEDLITLPLKDACVLSPILNEMNTGYRRSIIRGNIESTPLNTKLKYQKVLSPVTENPISQDYLSLEVEGDSKNGLNVPPHNGGGPEPSIIPTMVPPRKKETDEKLSILTPAKSFQALPPPQTSTSKMRLIRKSLSMSSLHNTNSFRTVSKTPDAKSRGFGSCLKRTESSFRLKKFNVRNLENNPPKRDSMIIPFSRFTPK